MFHKIQILPASIQNPFLEIHPFTGWGGGGGGGGGGVVVCGGGNISWLVYLIPHPRFWNGDCLHIMK